MGRLMDQEVWIENVYCDECAEKKKKSTSVRREREKIFHHPRKVQYKKYKGKEEEVLTICICLVFFHTVVFIQKNTLLALVH